MRYMLEHTRGAAEPLSTARFQGTSLLWDTWLCLCGFSWTWQPPKLRIHAHMASPHLTKKDDFIYSDISSAEDTRCPRCQSRIYALFLAFVVSSHVVVSLYFVFDRGSPYWIINIE